jgi:hypothetical protein
MARPQLAKADTAFPGASVGQPTEPCFRFSKFPSADGLPQRRLNWSMVNRSNRALVKMRFDANVNQRRESGCDEDGEKNGHKTTLKLVFMVN